MEFRSCPAGPAGYNTAVISVEEALERILSRVGVLGDEQVPLGRALHRVLAEPALQARPLLRGVIFAKSGAGELARVPSRRRRGPGHPRRRAAAVHRVSTG